MKEICYITWARIFMCLFSQLSSDQSLLSKTKAQRVVLLRPVKVPSYDRIPSFSQSLSLSEWASTCYANLTYFRMTCWILGLQPRFRNVLASGWLGKSFQEKRGTKAPKSHPTNLIWTAQRKVFAFLIEPSFSNLPTFGIIFWLVDTVGPSPWHWASPWEDAKSGIKS